MINFNRKQELALIELGLETLLDRCLKLTTKTRNKKSSSKKRKWSAEQRAKFSKTMQKHWKNRKATKHGQTV